MQFSPSALQFLAQAAAAERHMAEVVEQWKADNPGWIEVAPGILAAPDGSTLEW